jgi:hypothetical protein
MQAGSISCQQQQFQAQQQQQQQQQKAEETSAATGWRGAIRQLVCYGLGSPQASKIARYQVGTDQWRHAESLSLSLCSSMWLKQHVSSRACHLFIRPRS